MLVEDRGYGKVYPVRVESRLRLSQRTNQVDLFLVMRFKACNKRGARAVREAEERGGGLREEVV